MKKLLLFPILFLYLNSFSQDYVPFLDTNKMWIENYVFSDPQWYGNDFFGISVMTLEKFDDSVFILYSQTIEHWAFDGFENDPTYPYAVDYTVQPKFISSYLIEDTVNRKIYFSSTPNNFNDLLFDFLPVSDSAYIYNRSEKIAIDSIKTFQLLDESEFQRFYWYEELHYTCATPGMYTHSNQMTDNLVFYDSRMGSNMLFLKPYVAYGIKSEEFPTLTGCRICYSENNELLWGDSTLCEAYIRHIEYGDLGIDKIESKENSFSIYPNPVGNEMTVQFDEPNQSGIIQVLTIDGKVIIEQLFSNQKQVQLNLCEYNSGMYLIQFYSEENSKVLTKKIIKN